MNSPNSKKHDINKKNIHIKDPMPGNNIPLISLLITIPINEIIIAILY